MLASVRTAAVFGIEAVAVSVEVDVSFGLPGLVMVGLPDAAVRESRDRVRSAIRNSGFAFPQHRVTVNLAPADVRKAGAAFDLPIALGVLAATGIVTTRAITDALLVGELSLDGSMQPTRGVLPIAASARRNGCHRLLLPSANAAEASIVEGLRVLPVSSLQEAVDVLNDAVEPRAVVRPPRETASLDEPDLVDVQGQALRRRALEVTTGHAVAGLLPAGGGLITTRPFRAPHHTVSEAALVGGGSQPRPGEISLAHHGVLFLDEMPEFSRRALEVLRQPIEHGTVTIARAARTVVFPSAFMLVAAMNPCPCGHFGDPRRACRCAPSVVHRYGSRLSGPLRDRIDLIVPVAAVPASDLARLASGETSADVRRRVLAARNRQAERQRDRLNARLAAGQLRGAGFGVTNAARSQALAAAETLHLSARSYHRLLRVSRTVADLDASELVSPDHVSEALQFRGDQAV